MPTTKQIRYDDFSKGDWGDMSEFNAPQGSFQGMNVVVYQSGFIGPRAGLRETPYTGTMTGSVHGIFLPGMPTRTTILFVGDQLFVAEGNSVGLGNVAAEAMLTGGEPTSPIVATWYDPNQNIYFTSRNDRVYSFNMSSSTLSSVPVANSGADNAGVYTVYLCRDRLYAAGDPSVPPGGLGQRVYFSAAADFSNFVDGGFFDVGYFNGIKAAIESQNSLLFSSLESTNNIGSGVGWHALVGATPQGDLRRVNTQVASETQHEVVNADNGNYYFWTGWSASATDTPYLVQANGAKFNEEEFKHIRLQGSVRFGYYNAPDKTLMYMSDQGNAAWVRMNDVWTRHTFGVNLSGPICPVESGTSFLLAYGAPSTAVKVYEFLSQPDAPTASTSQSMPGDASTTCFDAYFSLPAYMSQGKEIRVRRVFVDFMKYNLSHASTNNFQVFVRQFGQYNLPAGGASTDNEVTQTWNESQSLASSTGTMDRFTVRVGQQGKAAGFQIGLRALRGVAIRAITVEFDEDDPEGRTI